ncbi:hypothetical protein N2152v2_003584 [Parachlorella kessleri]
MFVGQVPAIGHADVVWQGQRPGSSNPDKHLEKTRQQLNRLLGSSQSMTGTELRQLVFDKWGRSYDVRLQRRGKRMYLHVMWKHLEQQSFPLTEEEYDMQLQAVAEYLSMWGVADTVRTGIKGASKRGPGYTGGGSAKAVSIPLDVDVDGARSGEWNSFLS